MEILVYCFFGLMILLIMLNIHQYHTIKVNKKTIKYLIDERKRLLNENLELMKKIIND